MPTYKIQKKAHGYRRVKIGEESYEIYVPALIICLVSAAVIWLYIVNFMVESEVPPEATEPPAGDTAPAEPEADAPAA